MKPSEIAAALETFIRARRPVFVWGPPGVGKSDTVRQVAQKLSLEVRDIRALLLDPVDLHGLPYVSKGRAQWAIPGFLPDDGEGLIFLDELNAAPQSTQAACYSLVLDRKLGDYTLPPGWTIIAAGNRESDRAVVHRMPSALASRFLHLDFEVDVDDWCRWALQSGIRTELIAFIRFKREILHQFDGTQRTFPSPRTWKFVNDILEQNPPRHLEREHYAAAVGEGPATEFAAFLRVFRDLPSPDAILLNPEGAPIPQDPAALHAICGTLSRIAAADNIETLVRYANRLPDEFSVLLVKTASDRDPAIQRTRGFITWASAHNEVFG